MDMVAEHMISVKFFQDENKKLSLMELDLLKGIEKSVGSLGKVYEREVETEAGCTREFQIFTDEEPEAVKKILLKHLLNLGLDFKLSMY